MGSLVGAGARRPWVVLCQSLRTFTLVSRSLLGVHLGEGAGEVLVGVADTSMVSSAGGWKLCEWCAPQTLRCRALVAREDTVDSRSLEPNFKPPNPSVGLGVG